MWVCLIRLDCKTRPMTLAQPIFDLLPSRLFWGPANFRHSHLCKSTVSSFDVLVSSFLLLRKSLILIPSFAVLVSSFLLLATSHSPLATVPITPLESALTSHFAPQFDLKSFRMRTYVTPGGRGGAPLFARNQLIINNLLDRRTVLVPARSRPNLKNRRLRFSSCRSHNSRLAKHASLPIKSCELNHV